MSARYADPRCTLTLREGLDQYFSTFEGRFDPDACSTEETGEMFRCHDAAHVVFGTNTTLREETLTDAWTLSATDITWADGWAYAKSQESGDIFRMLGLMGILKSLLLALPDVPRVLARARRMNAKWGWYDWRDHLDRRLCDIRAELGLEILGGELEEAPAKAA
ncbi:MAG: hypothetical protein H6740_19260 [Alphaproteobacteria bacterium]|nr:hypothetical protein [Alphaproteobacteria bacterium]